MNKKIISSLLVATLLAGCDYNERNFEGLIEGAHPTDVKKLEITLTDADYTAISTNKANLAIAKDNGVDKELKALGTNKYFTSVITAATYAPAFLAEKYFTADDGSSVKITYNEKVSLPQYVNELNTATIYTLAAADYQKAWGDKSSLNFFTPAKPAATYLPGILAAKVADPAEGDIVCASYNVSEKEPADVTIAFKEDFEGGTANTNLELADWTNTTVKGTFKWQAKSFSGNLYAQQSAFKHVGALDSYLISKEITVEKGMSLTFDALYANFVKEGGAITVLISSNLADATTAEGIAAAKWDDLTGKFTIPTSTSGSGDMVNTGAADLSAYVGKKIRIAFRYQGDADTKATTTTRIDNVAISTPGKNVYQLENTLYAYDGTDWAPYTTANVLMLSQADFIQMGIKYDNFSSTMNADNYLPTFLKMNFPYAQQDDAKVVVYKYYDATSKVTSIRADEYIATNGQFVKNDAIETITSQFVRSNGKWNFDPSTVITLSTSKSDKETSAFYQFITDWVKANKGAKYVTSYGNNDYYYGGSAYNNNFDFRPSAWKGQVADEYTMADDALKELMYSRLPESFMPALEHFHADADVVSGVKVTYTINFSIYDGSSTLPWTIAYEVTGKGKFVYIKDSLKKIG